MLMCTFEKITEHPTGGWTHTKCGDKADILITNDPCYGLCYSCAYEKIKAENENHKQLVSGLENAQRFLDEKIENLQVELARLNLILFHRENGLSHPDPDINIDILRSKICELETLETAIKRKSNVL